MEVDLQLEDRVEHKVHCNSRDHAQRNEVQDPKAILHVDVQDVVHDVLVDHLKDVRVDVDNQKPNAHVDVLDFVLVVAQNPNKEFNR